MSTETKGRPLPVAKPVRWWKWIAGFLVILITCMGLWPLVGMLAFGWVPFVKDHVTQFSLDTESVCWAVLGLTILLVGGHWMCVLFCKNKTDDDSAKATWPFSGTIKILLGLLALAITGISMVSVAHQVTWLVKEPVGIQRLLSRRGHGIAMRRAQSQNNLKNIALGAIIHESAKQRLPQSSFSSTGRPLHNWITHLLPELGRPDLADQLDHAKPWYDPTQRYLFETEIELLLRYEIDEKKDEDGWPVTHYAANERLISGQRDSSLARIKDGASNTILFGESYDQFPAWGQPLQDRDPARGLNVPGGFGTKFAPDWGVAFSMADGALLSISPDIDPEVLRQLATPNGGETISPDQIQLAP